MSHGETNKVNVVTSMYLHESWGDKQGECSHVCTYMSHGETNKVNVVISMYLHESWGDKQGECSHKCVPLV